MGGTHTREIHGVRTVWYYPVLGYSGVSNIWIVACFIARHCSLNGFGFKRVLRKLSIHYDICR